VWGEVQIPKNKIQTITNIKPTNTQTPAPIELRSVSLEVPFTSQAPDGNWKEERFQDGCEEAAAVMAHCAISKSQCPISNGVIDKEFVKNEILKMAKWQEDNYGSFVDTSVEDTANRLIGEYFGLEYGVLRLASSGDIVRELMEGNIVITPMNGRLLDNPNFTAPGPERHMVLVRGYDHETKEFVTNDPGTRKGEKYRYPVDVFWNAIRDYPTGDHERIVDEEKRMVVARVAN
jgi:hypothetical protein